jgi:hypothetical protein
MVHRAQNEGAKSAFGRISIREGLAPQDALEKGLRKVLGVMG